MQQIIKSQYQKDTDPSYNLLVKIFVSKVFVVRNEKSTKSKKYTLRAGTQYCYCIYRQ